MPVVGLEQGVDHPNQGKLRKKLPTSDETLRTSSSRKPVHNNSLVRGGEDLLKMQGAAQETSQNHQALQRQSPHRHWHRPHTAEEG